MLLGFSATQYLGTPILSLKRTIVLTLAYAGLVDLTSS